MTDQAPSAHLDRALGPLPPYFVRDNFLPDAEHGQLLRWTLDHHERFKPATINAGREGSPNEVVPEKRIALVTRKLDGIGEGLGGRLLAAFDAVAGGIGYRGPPPTSVELEVAAHGDGAHFTHHVDIPLGPDRAPLGTNPQEDRIVSAVLYFHRQPKAFSGGILRLYRFGVDVASDGSAPAHHVDIEPADNCLGVSVLGSARGAESQLSLK